MPSCRLRLSAAPCFTRLFGKSIIFCARNAQTHYTAFARACLSGKKLLFLDEPTVGQDFQNLKRMVETVNAAHKATGMTMITVTHDVRCADALADRVLWIRDGLVYKQGGKELIGEYEQAQKQ